MHFPSQKISFYPSTTCFCFVLSFGGLQKDTQQGIDKNY